MFYDFSEWLPPVEPVYLDLCVLAFAMHPHACGVWRGLWREHRPTCRTLPKTATTIKTNSSRPQLHGSLLADLWLLPLSLPFALLPSFCPLLSERQLSFSLFLFPFHDQFESTTTDPRFFPQHESTSFFSNTSSRLFLDSSRLFPFAVSFRRAFRPPWR